jgi:hypothetical protein
MEMPSSCVLVMRKFDMPTVRTIEYEAMEGGCTFTVVRTSATDSTQTQTLELTVIGSCATGYSWDGTTCIEMTCEAPGIWESSVNRCIQLPTGAVFSIEVLPTVFEYKQTVAVGDRVIFNEFKLTEDESWFWENPAEMDMPSSCVLVMRKFDLPN